MFPTIPTRIPRHLVHSRTVAATPNSPMQRSTLDTETAVSRVLAYVSFEPSSHLVEMSERFLLIQARATRVHFQIERAQATP